jgi:hypothetical protein
MLGHLFLDTLVGAPSGGEVLEPRQKPPQKSHLKSSVFISIPGAPRAP